MTTYYTKAKQAIKRLEKKTNDLFSSVHSKPNESWLAFYEARERMLDKQSSFRYVETEEQKSELWLMVDELTKRAKEAEEALKDGRQFAFSMAELRLRKEAQIETNNRLWQAI